MTIGVSTYGAPEHVVFRGDVSNLVIGSFCSIAGGETRTLTALLSASM
jgi:hypothetical protein